MKRFKKVLAGIMAATLVMSSATMFMAEESTDSGVEGSSTGTGSMEEIIDTKIFRVVLPTVPEKSPFDFILDPAGTIEATSGSAYKSENYNLGATGSMYFMQASPANLLTNESSTLVVTNKSSVDVNITLTAKVTTASDSGVKFVTGSNFGTATDRGIYFNLNGIGTTTTSAAVAATASDASIGVATIEATMASADAYYSKEYDATSDSYSYVLDETAAAGQFATYGFYVNGACNTAANWTGYTDAASLEVIWKLEGVGMETVQAADPVFKTGNTAGLITWINGTETQVKTIDSVTMTNSKKTWNALEAYSDKWEAGIPEVENCKIVLDTAFASTDYFDETNNTATIKYTDSKGAQHTVTVKVKLAN